MDELSYNLKDVKLAPGSWIRLRQKERRSWNATSCPGHCAQVVGRSKKVCVIEMKKLPAISVVAVSKIFVQRNNTSRAAGRGEFRVCYAIGYGGRADRK